MICFINFNRSTKNLRNVSTHRNTYLGNGPEYSLTLDPCFITNRFSTQSMQKPPENTGPFLMRQIKRETMWQLLIFTPSTSTLSSSYNIGLFKRTSRTGETMSIIFGFLSIGSFSL